MNHSISGAVRGGPRLITQRELARYAALAAEVRRLKEQQQRLRGDLLAALEGGARVEPGPYSPRVTRRLTQTLSRERVERVLGVAGLEDLLRRLETTEQVRLRVVNEDERRRHF
jgi:hypothetical protein